MRRWLTWSKRANKFARVLNQFNVWKRQESQLFQQEKSFTCIQMSAVIALTLSSLIKFATMIIKSGSDVAKNALLVRPPTGLAGSTETILSEMGITRIYIFFLMKVNRSARPRSMFNAELCLAFLLLPLEKVHYSPTLGCYCANYKQPDGICNYDYKVRFKCCKWTDSWEILFIVNFVGKINIQICGIIFII